MHSFFLYPTRKLGGLIPGVVLGVITHSASAQALDGLPTLPPVIITGQRPATTDGQEGTDFGQNYVFDIEPQFHSGRNYGWDNVYRGPRTMPASETNSPSDDCGKSPKGEHPVIYATGEKVQDESDFTDVSLAGLSLLRTYRSTITANDSLASVNAIFGPNWHASIQYPKMVFSPGCRSYSGSSWLGCVPDWVKISLPDGTTHAYVLRSLPVFFPTGGDGNGVLGYMKVMTTQQWQVIVGERQYNYNPQTKNLESIYERGVLLYTYNYSGDKLASVTTAYGKSVSFTWDGDRVSQVADPDGKVWTYGYDAARNLTSVTPPPGTPGVIQYHYESPVDRKLLTGITVDGERTTRYAYDSSSRVTHSGFENGESFDDLVYGAGYTTVTDEKGQSVQFNFSQAGNFKRLTSVSRATTSTCAATASSQDYDANGNISYKVDWNGIRAEYSYNADGQLLEERAAVSTPAASKRVYTWSTDKLSETTSYNTANEAFLKSKLSYFSTSGPDNGRTSNETVTDLRTGAVRQTDYRYSFYPTGVLATETSSLAANAETTRAYDSSGNLTTITNAVGHQIQFNKFTGLGRPREMVDANGVVTTYEYDARGNVLSQSTALPNGNRVFRYTYGGRGERTSIQEPDGQITKFDYNSAGRLISSTNGRGEIKSYLLDVAARQQTIRSSREVPGLNGTTPVANSAGEFSKGLIFDSLGRLRNEAYSAGRMSSRTYDGNGNVKQVTDPSGHATVYEYDAKNRMVKTTAPDGGVTQLIYDGDDHLQYVIDPRGLQTTYGYNAFGNRTSVSSPDTGTTTFTYDSVGLMASAAYPNGKTITYYWDGLGRLLSRNSSDGVSDNFTYDQGAYGNGHMTRMNDWTGQTDYAFNAAGELIGQTNNIYGQVFNTSWDYDSSGKLMSMTYPTGLVLNYSYDELGRVSAVRSGTALKTSR